MVGGDFGCCEFGGGVNIVFNCDTTIAHCVCMIFWGSNMRPCECGKISVSLGLSEWPPYPAQNLPHIVQSDMQSDKYCTISDTKIQHSTVFFFLKITVRI